MSILEFEKKEGMSSSDAFNNYLDINLTVCTGHFASERVLQAYPASCDYSHHSVLVDSGSIADWPGVQCLPERWTVWTRAHIETELICLLFCYEVLFQVFSSVSDWFLVVV